MVIANSQYKDKSKVDWYMLEEGRIPHNKALIDSMRAIIYFESLVAFLNISFHQIEIIKFDKVDITGHLI